MTELREEVVSTGGDPTAYSLLLSLDNTQQFTEYYRTASLMPEQQRTMEDALSSLKAPCFD